MSNMDELLINAHLQERQPASLPWNGNDERSKADCSKNVDEIDARPSRYNRYISDHNLLYKSNNEECRHSGKHFRGGSERCDNETNVLFCNTDITFTEKKTASPGLECTDGFGNKTLGYKPSWEERLSNNDRRPTSFGYNYFERKSNSNHVALTSATKVGSIQNKSRKSPRSSVKVSRQIIQESKLGYSLPTLRDTTKPENKGKTSRSSNFLLNRETKNECNQENESDTKVGLTRTKDEKNDRILARKIRQSEQVEKPLLNTGCLQPQNKTIKIGIDKQLNELLNGTDDVPKSQNIGYKAQRGNVTEDVLKAQRGGDTSVRKDNTTAVNASTMTEMSLKRNLSFKCNESGTKSTKRYFALHNKGMIERNVEEPKYNKALKDMNKSHYKDEKDEKNDKQDQDRYDEYSEDLNKDRQKAENRETGEDKDEILKFTCQMMEIKQPKLMRKKKSKVGDNLVYVRGRDSKAYEDNVDVIDVEKVEELNKKSEDKFRKIIRDRKKKRDKKTIVINVDPDCVRKKVRKKEKLRANGHTTMDTRDVRQNYPSIKCEIEENTEDNEVFDISPAKNRETLTDSESETTYLPKQKNGTDVDSVTKQHVNTNVQKVNKVKVSKSYTIVSHDLKPETVGKDTVMRPKSILKSAKGLKVDNERKMKTYDENKLSKKVYLQDTHNIDMRYVDKFNDNGLNKNRNERDDACPHLHKEPLQMPKRVNIHEEITNIDNYNGPLHHIGQGTSQMDWGDIMYDSDTSSNIDSCYGSEQDYFSRPPTTTPRELEFPRPISNRTFILYNKDENDENISTEHDSNIDIGTNYGDVVQNEEKLGKLQRFLRWLTCCVRPKTDN